MQIALLCEFGGKNGWGHLIRCSALAQAARQMGWRVILLGDGPSEAMPKESQSAFDKCIFVESFDQLPVEVITADVLFADFMYWDDERYEALRFLYNPNADPSKLLVATDDMQQRTLESVDVVVNTEIGLRHHNYRPKKFSLLGERYCYLREGFSSRKRKEPKFNPKEAIKAFIMIGGTDPWNLSVPVLQELSSIDGYSFVPILVSGEQLQKVDEIKDALQLFSSYKWVCSVSSFEMAELMASCHLGIIACGSSVYEMAALNVPFVGLSIVDNQTATARKIGTEWELPVLHIENRSETKALGVASAVSDLLKRLSDTTSNYSIVDSHGCRRILEAIEGAVG